MKPTGPRQGRLLCGSSIVVLWAAALWHSWLCRGLYSDGSDFLLDMVLHGRFGAGLLDPRAHAIWLSQLPAMLGMELGVTDLHWLARLQSLGLFGVPTALYSLALWRARRVPLVLATMIAAVAIVFMTTSYFIIGEYNTAYASAILAGVYFATARELTVRDGLVVAFAALLGARSYEHFVYLGPLLGAAAVAMLVRLPSRSRSARFLYGAAAACFTAGAVVAGLSLVEWFEGDSRYTTSLVTDARDFRFNVQLDLLLAAVATLAVWGGLRPRDLETRTPWLAAGLVVLLVALSPALVFIERFVSPPYSWTQQASRTAAGPLTAAIVVFLCLQSPAVPWRLPALLRLRTERIGHRPVLLAFAMLVAMLPWDILLTGIYSRYLDVVREAIHRRSGPFVADDSLIALHPRLVQHDAFPASLSLILRRSPTDGVLVRPASDGNVLQSFDPAAPPDLGRFRWRD